MMEIKARVFHPLVNVSLEDLVPADHFYRYLERTLDLTFVRDLVRDRYAAGGRPSIEPVVFHEQAQLDRTSDLNWLLQHWRAVHEHIIARLDSADRPARWRCHPAE
jgi:hypothetical protein